MATDCFTQVRQWHDPWSEFEFFGVHLQVTSWDVMSNFGNTTMRSYLCYCWRFILAVLEKVSGQKQYFALRSSVWGHFSKCHALWAEFFELVDLCCFQYHRNSCQLSIWQPVYLVNHNGKSYNRKTIVYCSNFATWRSALISVSPDFSASAIAIDICESRRGHIKSSAKACFQRICHCQYRRQPCNVINRMTKHSNWSCISKANHLNGGNCRALRWRQ